MSTNYIKALRTNVYGNNPNVVQITYQKEDGYEYGNMIFCIGSETSIHTWLNFDGDILGTLMLKDLLSYLQIFNVNKIRFDVPIESDPEDGEFYLRDLELYCKNNNYKIEEIPHCYCDVYLVPN